MTTAWTSPPWPQVPTESLRTAIKTVAERLISNPINALVDDEVDRKTHKIEPRKGLAALRLPTLDLSNTERFTSDQ